MGVIYCPLGDTSPNLSNKFSRGIRTLLNETNLKFKHFFKNQIVHKKIKQSVYTLHVLNHEDKNSNILQHLRSTLGYLLDVSAWRTNSMSDYYSHLASECTGVWWVVLLWRSGWFWLVWRLWEGNGLVGSSLSGYNKQGFC